MTTITATASGGTRNWSDTATWSPAQVPTAADDVVLASTSGNVTIDVNSVCRSIDGQASGNYTGTLSHAAGVYLTIGDGTAGAGNRIVRLSPSMTVSSNGDAWNLKSTSATQQTVTSAGKSINWLTITGGASSSYLLADALTVTVSLVHNIGTFNTGNQAVTCGSFVSSNSNTRTLTLGSSTITCTGTSGWDCANTTNMTVNAGTSTIVLTDTSASTKTFAGGNKTYYRLLIQGGATNAITVTGANTWDRINVPAGTVLTFPASTTQTFTGAGIVTSGRARNYIRLPGIAGHYLSVPSSSEVNFTGSLALIVDVLLANWASGSTQGLLRKESSWTFNVSTTGLLSLAIVDGGSTVRTMNSSVAVGFAADTRYQVAVTFDTTSGTNNVRFWTRADSSAAWTQLGTTQSSTGTGISTSANAVGIGATSTGTSPLTGNVYRAIAIGAVGASGTVPSSAAALDVDTSTKPFGADSWVCASGQTVTVNGDLAKAGDGRVLLNSATLGTTATISKSGGQMVLPFTTVKDITFSGGAAFIAPPPSVLVSNTSGIRNGARYGISADGTQFFKY